MRHLILPKRHWQISGWNIIIAVSYTHLVWNMLNNTEKDLLRQIAGISGFQPGSAFNLRANGAGVRCV